MLETNDRPDVAERYATACTSSNLRVEAERGSSADVLIASGWSKSRVGGALMRLYTEYGSFRMPPNAIGKMDAMLAMGKLVSLRQVLEIVTQYAADERIEQPKAVAMAVVAHFLDDVCKSCNKLGKERIPGTPMLSNRSCKACKGTGSPMLPYGEAGRHVSIYIEDCVNMWRASTSKALHGRRLSVHSEAL